MSLPYLMKLELLSWNASGISLPHHKYKVKEMVIKWTLDVVFLQEVKINDIRLNASLHNIWKDATFIHTAHSDGKGGVVIGMAPWVSKYVIDKGEDPSHSCAWALKLINGQLIGFCSIYASNFVKERISLWDWLANNLPNADWILGGDFNMVEHSHDRSWNSFLKLSRDEFDSWVFCRNSIGVIDPIHDKFSSHSKNWYT